MSDSQRSKNAQNGQHPLQKPVGLYDPQFEHESCGVGLVADAQGRAKRLVVEHAITALKSVWHRGAVDADGKTGDGAGIHIEIPKDFFLEQIERTGHKPKEGSIAVGMVFLPRTSLPDQELCRQIIESEIIGFNYEIYGWRRVPIDTSVIGVKAAQSRPDIEQIMIHNPGDEEAAVFEKRLYHIRRRIEKRIIAAQISGFYICSLSCRSIIYKGLFLAQEIDVFYQDLQDPRFISRFAIFHQRYSTNTFPQWWLSQPFRVLAHNGEINTIRGNVNWMRSHEIKMTRLDFGRDCEDIKPIIPAGASDTAALDSVAEALVRAGRDAPTAKLMLIPEAAAHSDIPDQHKDMYTYFNAVMEPWDGPAAIAMTDGRWVVAGMDRNALRPMRYCLTDDDILIIGSEAGQARIAQNDIKSKGRLGPGEMLAIDLDEGCLYLDPEIKDLISKSEPFSKWVEGFKTVPCISELAEAPLEEGHSYDDQELRRRQIAAGYTHEDLEMVLQPMVDTAKEATGSMGDDTPLAVLSDQSRSFSHFFKQNFSQVTNPPIDSLRESRVMSLRTRFGNFTNVLERPEAAVEVLVLDSPVLTNGEWHFLKSHFGEAVAEIDCTFEVDDNHERLQEALTRIQEQAEQAVRSGKGHIFLTDEMVGPERMSIQAILSTAAVHSHLVNKGLRSFTSINVRASECLDTHYYAVLIGVGATTVNAYLSQASIVDRHAKGLFETRSLQECIERARKAIEDGLRKIMSKMGIAVISSYRGGYNFEAVGLSRSLTNAYFPGMPNRISGMGIKSLHYNATKHHQDAWKTDKQTLHIGSLYRYRAGGETHSFQGELLRLLQSAVTNDSYSQYQKFSQALEKMKTVALRDLLEFKWAEEPVNIDEVETITEIRKRFVTPGMSMGALSKEAHETLAIAMNRIGAKSVSGEGGEDNERYQPRPNGDNANSTIKQIASGRFGVTAEYLNACEEIEIKVAQGAKPGEGGQLPGFKVTDLIAHLRHSTPGVSLISPPPHHDIYSIEDLAQLIYDLKQINPKARVCVKLVSSAGIGTIAAGVAKAHADVITISGHNGGTGAAPLTSIIHAGTPWEIGLAEVNQVLSLNGLRQRVLLRTDGGLKTGRDIVIAAILGAEEFGIGSLSLIVMGCLIVRQCHSNTCPVGICTQDESLRAKFTGTPEKVINLFTFIAEEVREILARLGCRSLQDAIGRTDLLQQVSRGAEHLDELDLNLVLAKVDAPPEASRFNIEGNRNPVPDSLDAQMLKDAQAVFERGEKMQLTYIARNTMRSIGTRFASHLTRKYGMFGLAPDHVTIRLRGSCGQSLGAFAVQGMRLVVFGEANDYVGKGLSGACIIVRPMASSKLATQDNTIIGNTVLYGATAGQLFAAGQAGERFAVRNSGADTVVEGCGANGCEYMTGGIAVILGRVGSNFGAGMTGGMAFVYDRKGQFESKANPESIVWRRLESKYWEDRLIDLISAHAYATGSKWASDILTNWDHSRNLFWQICPKEMLDRLEHPLAEDAQAAE